MIEDEVILKNKERFISLTNSITREGMDKELLIDMLEKSDFFTAPASSMFHSNYKGGLCQHCLNVYDELVKLVDITYPKFITDNNGELMEVENYSCPISEDSMKITALFHDISKINFYEVSTRNTKDEKGAWISVPYIKTKDAKERFLYSTHGVNSEYLVGRYIPLTLEESVAIINHMGGKEQGNSGFDSTLSEIFNRYPLSILLHTADLLATFILEAI